MWSSPLFWIAVAIALFWALGAYNRLVRLRSAAVQSFGGLDAHMVRQVALLGEFNAAHAVRRDGVAAGPADPEMAALQGATTQLSASLAVARARPLHADAVAALAAARDVLLASWQSALRKLQDTQPPAAPPALPGGSDAASAGAPPAPMLWQVRWEEHMQQCDQALRVFNDAVAQYNMAVTQFPANLLARTFGFKTARAL